MNNRYFYCVSIDDIARGIDSEQMAQLTRTYADKRDDVIYDHHIHGFDNVNPEGPLGDYVYIAGQQRCAMWADIMAISAWISHEYEKAVTLSCEIDNIDDEFNGVTDEIDALELMAKREDVETRLQSMWDRLDAHQTKFAPFMEALYNDFMQKS